MIDAGRDGDVRSPGDEALRSAIVGRLKSLPWIRSSLIKVDVLGGSAELSGACDTQAQQRAMRVVAETTPGVHSVEDKLWVQ